MGKGYRQSRMGEEIRKIISQLLLREIKDPKLAGRMISISAVEVTRDGSYATVYLSVLGSKGDGYASDKEKDEILQAFAKAKGLIKREIGKQIKLRHVPELLFKVDNSMEYGAHMSKVIDGLDIKNCPDTEDAGFSEADEILKDLE